MDLILGVCDVDSYILWIFKKVLMEFNFERKL